MRLYHCDRQASSGCRITMCNMRNPIIPKAASLFLSLYAICMTPGFAQDNVVVPPKESVEGFTQSEWSRAWWQWAGSFEHSESPVADQTGALCGGKQQGAVWFLAGTYGTKRTMRTCVVPKGKYIFFPLINYVVMPPADRPISCKSVMNSAAYMTDDVSSLVVELNGIRMTNLTAHRQATQKCFFNALFIS